MFLQEAAGPWTEDVWTGVRPTSLNQEGTELTGFNLGNASAITLTSTESFNSGGDKDEEVTYSLSPPSLGFTGGAFSITDTVIQQGYEVFEIGDAGIAFMVSQAGIVSLGINSGTLVSTNYTNGQDLGQVAVDTERTLTGSVLVPDGFANTGELVPITGFTATQPLSPVWTIDDATVGIGTLGVDRTTGLAGGGPVVLDAILVSIEWIDATNGNQYPVLHIGADPVTRVARITIRPTGQYINPDARATVDIDVIQRAGTIGEFTLADLELYSLTAIPSVGLVTGANAILFVGSAYDSTIDSILATQNIAPNHSTDSRLVTLHIRIDGEVPAGFINEGEEYTFVTSIQVPQAGVPVTTLAHINGAFTTLLIGNSRTLTGAVSGTSSGPASFQWSVTGGLQINGSSTSQSVEIEANVDVDGTVRLEVTRQGVTGSTTRSIPISSSVMAEIPTVTTLIAELGLFVGANLDLTGVIEDDGEGTITEAGFDYGYFNNLNQSVEAISISNGVFVSNSGPLTDGTVYYRAYATNEAGTGYGENQNYLYIIIIPRRRRRWRTILNKSVCLMSIFKSN